MSVPSFSVRNRVLVNMLMFVVLAAGLILATTLVREMFPESRPTELRITADYPGVQPPEIEKAVTIKIEEAVHDIEGVEKVDSVVNEGRTIITLTLLNEVKNVDVVLQEVKTEVDAVQDLPEDVERVVVEKHEPELPVISVALFGEGDEAGLKRAARALKDDLEALPGISKVQLNGVRDDEISVEVIPDKLIEFDVTFDEIALAIRQTNLDISGGQIKGSRNTFSVRTVGEEMRGRDLEDIVVRSSLDGKKVYLRDVATVKDEFVDMDLESLFNGKPSMSCVVYKTKTQDSIQIAQLVRAYVLGKQHAVGLNLDTPFDPYGFGDAYASAWYVKPFKLVGCWISKITAAKYAGKTLEYYYKKSREEPFPHHFDAMLHSNLARFVEGRLDLMTRNGKAGLVLVLISLYLFLNWRIAFWAATGLVVSFLGTFVVMWMFGATINLLTMFGLIIVLGIIVDDAIVIGENIYRHVEDGEDPMFAAVKGAEEVMWPVIVAVLTTVGAFLPMFFISGRIGDFLRQLPIVVVSALSVSLVEALIILPAHLAHLPRHKRRKTSSPDGGDPHGRPGLVSRMQSALMRGLLIKYYERFLRFALRWRYVTLAVSVALVMISLGLVAGDVVKFEFIQKMDSETVICSLEMPVGTTAEITKRKLQLLGDEIARQPEVASAQMFVAMQIDLSGMGATGNQMQSHLGQIVIELLPADERDVKHLRSSSRLLDDMREFSLQHIAGANSVTWEEMTGGPGGKDIEIKISGKNFDRIKEAQDELKAMLATYEGVHDLDDNFDEGKREVQLRLRESAAVTGMRLYDLGNQVRSALYGREARRLTRNREDVKIMVRYPEEYRENVYHIETMWIPSLAVGGRIRRVWIPLTEVASVTETTSFTAIHRSQMARSLTVFGEVNRDVSTPGKVLAEVKKRIPEELESKFPGVSFEFLGSEEERIKSFSSLRIAFPVALLIIYTLLAGLFRSYAQPLVVMAVIPFGVLGAIVGHLVTGNPITILSLIGMLALTGILVNDSLVLVDFINHRVAQGMSEYEASIEGPKLRLRAILLTTLTTIAGLLPIMFETSFQARFLIPMAVTLTFGLGFATMLTLLVVPVLNLIFFDIRSLFLRDRTAEQPDATAPSEKAFI